MLERVAREIPWRWIRNRLSVELELRAREGMGFREPHPAAKRQQNQFGCKEASVNHPVVWLQNEPSKDQIPHALGKRQLPVLRVRAYSTVRTPLCPCPSPWLSAAAPPPKVPRKQNPPQLIRVPRLDIHGLTFQGLCAESKRSPCFCQNPNYLKNDCGRARPRTSPTVLTAPGLWPRFPEPQLRQAQQALFPGSRRWAWALCVCARVRVPRARTPCGAQVWGCGPDAAVGDRVVYLVCVVCGKMRPL